MNSFSFFTPYLSAGLFDTIQDTFSHATDKEVYTFAPKADIKETETEYILNMDLPGLTENDVTITLKGKVLSISSIMENKPDEKECNWLIRERKTLSFVRKFTLPEEVDTETIKASLINGILNINITRKSESQVKNIRITSTIN